MNAAENVLAAIPSEWVRGEAVEFLERYLETRGIADVTSYVSDHPDAAAMLYLAFAEGARVATRRAIDALMTTTNAPYAKKV